MPEKGRSALRRRVSLQNRDGGWSTYERQRGPRWLERFSPLDVFSNFLVDASHVECTSACMQALAEGGKARPEAPVGPAIARGRDFLRRLQRADGSWEGMWGVCFSYCTWFGVSGLVAAGVPLEDSALRRAVAFLRSHQQGDGSWSETVQRGVRWLRQRQREDGGWPREPLAGVFNRTCAIHYDAYLHIFPPWAVSLAERHVSSPGADTRRATEPLPMRAPGGLVMASPGT